VLDLFGPKRKAWFEIVLAGDVVKKKKPDPEIYNLAKQRLGLGGGKVVGFIGQLGVHKGVDTVLEAMPLVWREHPDASLLIAGARTVYAAQVEAKVAKFPEELRSRVTSDPKLASTAGAAWDTIASAEKLHASKYEREYVITQALAGSPTLMNARRIVRWVVEKEKPNEKRLPEYRDSARGSLELALYSPAPVYPALEKVTIADGFTKYGVN